MRKRISPGVFWAVFLLAGLAILIIKYRTDKTNLFEPDILYMSILIMFIACSLYTYFFDRNKSRLESMVSFLFGLFFWIPLLNLIFAIPSLYLGIKSLKKIKFDSNYGGKWFAVVGMVLSSLVYATYLIGVFMCILGNKGICSNMGLSFLAG